MDAAEISKCYKRGVLFPLLSELVVKHLAAHADLGSNQLSSLKLQVPCFAACGPQSLAWSIQHMTRSPEMSAFHTLLLLNPVWGNRMYSRDKTRLSLS